MAIQLFTRQKIDGQSLRLGYNNLEKLHDNTVKNITTLQSLVGQLELNESEDAWKTQYVQELNNTIDGYINSTSSRGNNPRYYGDAFTETSLLVGKVLTDPSLQGRIREQTKYKEWKKNLEDGVGKGLYSRDVADMYLEQNPYRYYDKYEGETDEIAVRNRNQERINQQQGIPSTGEHGKIIGGVGGNYGNPTKDVSMTSILNLAAQRVAIEGGGSTTLYYKKADGSLTTNSAEADPTNPYPWFKDTYDNVKQIDENRLKQAAWQIINEQPGAKAGLEQALKVGLWKTGKQYNFNGSSYTDANGNIIDNEFTDERGLPLSIDKYIESLINPAARLMSRNVGKYSREKGYGMEYSAEIAKAYAQNLGKKSNTTGTITPPSTASATVDRFAETALTALYNKQAISDELKEIAKQYKIDPNDSKFYEKMMATGNPAIMEKVYDYWMNEENAVVNNHANKEEYDALEYVNSVNFGSTLSNDNSYKNNLYNYINQLYTNNGNVQDAIYINTKYGERSAGSYLTGPYIKDYSQDIINNITENGKYKLEDLGLKLENGMIVVPRDKAYLIPKIISSVENTGFGGLTFLSYTVDAAADLLANNDPHPGITNLIYAGLNKLDEDNKIRQIGQGAIDWLRGLRYDARQFVEDASRGVNATLGNTLNTEILYKDNNGKYTSRSKTNYWELYGPSLFNRDLQYNDPVVQQIKALNDKAVDVVDNYNKIQTNDSEYNNKNYGQLINDNTQFVPFASINQEIAQSMGLENADINRIIEQTKASISAHSPKEDAHFYFGDKNSLHDVDDIEQRMKITDQIAGILATDPNRVQLGYNSDTGETMINVSPGTKTNNANWAKSISDDFNAGFMVMGDFINDDPVYQKYFYTPARRGKKLLRNADLTNRTHIPIIPQVMSIDKKNGQYFLVTPNNKVLPLTEDIACAIAGNIDEFKKAMLLGRNMTQQEVKQLKDNIIKDTQMANITNTTSKEMLDYYSQVIEAIFSPIPTFN